MQIAEHLHMVGSEQFGLSHFLDCNCYLIDAGDAIGLVDTGSGLGADAILENIAKEGFRPDDLTHIFITHAHLGHWGGAAAIRAATRAEIWVPAAARHSMEHIEEDRTIWQNFKFGRYPEQLKVESCTPDHVFGDGERIAFGKFALDTILVQGHTKDSTCLALDVNGRRVLFTGDVLFYAGKLGIINAEGASLEDYRRDIQKLADLNVDTLLPGHGVFILGGGQKHIDRGIRMLNDFVLPETFFETNEFTWQQDYQSSMGSLDA
jgi:glyoxylase-like metal-dependent hydrolase (beta-lactamase superfamily II)